MCHLVSSNKSFVSEFVTTYSRVGFRLWSCPLAQCTREKQLYWLHSISCAHYPIIAARTSRQWGRPAHYTAPQTCLHKTTHGQCYAEITLGPKLFMEWRLLMCLIVSITWVCHFIGQNWNWHFQSALVSQVQLDNIPKPICDHLVSPPRPVL